MQSSLVDDRVSVPAGLYGDTPGANSYGWGGGKSAFQWMGCRNSLNALMNKNLARKIHDMDMEKAKAESSFFQRVAGDVECYARLIHMLEGHLNLYSRTTLHTTAKPQIVRLDPSVFWYSVPLRLSFFTLYVRAASTASQSPNQPPEIAKVISYEAYFKSTAAATDLFLNGHTYCDEHHAHGWTDFFGNGMHVHFLHNPRAFTHEIWLSFVRAKTEALARDGFKDCHARAEFLCGLAACVG